MAIDRSAIRNNLAGRTAQSYANKDNEGGFRIYVRPTNGRPVFRKFAEGQIMFDIIPFAITANFMLDPDAPGKPKYLAGQWRYFLEVFSHMNIGPNNWNVACPNKNFGLPCPICEEFSRLQAAGADWDTVLKPLKLNRRCVYNIWMHDVPALKEEAKGVQLLEIAHFSLEANILSLARDPRTGAVTEIADPDNGRTIYFERKGTKADNTKYTGFQLLPRDIAIPDEILEQAVPLNEAIEILDYEALDALFHGGAAPAPAGDEPGTVRAPRRGPLSAPAAAAPQKTPLAAPSAPAATPPRRPAPQAASEPETVPPAATPPAAPARRPAPAAAATAAAPEPAPAAGGDQCPHGMIFGQDTDKIEACNGCDLYDACGAAFDANN